MLPAAAARFSVDLPGLSTFQVSSARDLGAPLLVSGDIHDGASHPRMIGIVLTDGARPKNARSQRTMLAGVSAFRTHEKIASFHFYLIYLRGALPGFVKFQAVEYTSIPMLSCVISCHVGAFLTCIAPT